MYHIGYLVSKNQKSEYIDRFLDDQLYNFHEIGEDELFDYSSLDGLVLEETDSNINWVCSLLMKLKERSDLLVWVLSPEVIVPKSIRLVYLQLGANGVADSSDDFDEFSLIVRNTLERCKDTGRALPSKTAIEKEETHDFQLLPKNLSVVLEDGKEVELTKLEFMVIQYLHRHAQETVTYEEIYENVWKSGEPCRYRVSNMIFHLRRKIEKDEKEPRYIKNVRSLGYKLVI
ncbi:winged helix family transcriptional regulator [Enterococcus sp. BWR-S5]|uniref:winged helix family transcriptional regulator n=1 Tax=Enterococcus sp. BWR-S5 TaxID=2787714 RepID=UPI0019230A0D|nr:winged helix family transcriptional regulator [Enterococcus sp. BWR-S5]MBL1225602.1 winged helix-turn-helix domain-containing protein [Enterococcus sp. BWR-S5]